MSLFPGTTLGQMWDSLTNKWTGRDLTGAQIAENEFNAQEAEKARVFNANEAEKAREWEEQMSNTAYQRQVADLEAAGLNPALGYGSNGATTPAGEAASGPAAAAGTNNNGMSMGELLQVLQLPLSIMQQEADINLTRANVNKTNEEVYKTYMEGESIFKGLTLLDKQIEGADWDNKTKAKMYGYIDRMQEATIAVQEATAAEKTAAIAQINKQVEKMDYEEAKIMYDILETQENINFIITQEHVNAAQVQQLKALTNKLNKEAKLIGLNIDNFDFITVLGQESTSGSGPLGLGGSTSKPFTLADLKKKVKDIIEENDKIRDKVDNPYDTPDNTD